MSAITLENLINQIAIQDFKLEQLQQDVDIILKNIFRMDKALEKAFPWYKQVNCKCGGVMKPTPSGRLKCGNCGKSRAA